MIVERVTGQRPTGDGNESFTWLRRIYTFSAVAAGWVLFRADNLSDAVAYLRALVPSGGWGDLAILEPSQRSLLVLAISMTVVLVPRSFSGNRLLTGDSAPSTFARIGTLGVALPLAAVLILGGSFSPFLYFQF